MALLTNQQVAVDGLEPSYSAAAAGGDEFRNLGRTMLHVKNGGASACVVTIASLAECNQGGTHNGGGSVPAGEDWLFGPFAPSRFNAADGNVNVTYDQVTTVTVAAIELPEA